MKQTINYADKRTTITNAIDGATSNSAKFGFKPCACKGGATTNFEIPEEMFKRELYEYRNGGTINA